MSLAGLRNVGRNPFRIYESRELGKDGYPIAWHHGFIRVAKADMVWSDWFAWQGGGPHVPEDGAFQMGGIKDVVRTQAGDRCLRCGHPYVVGQDGSWEPNRSASAKARASSEAPPTLEGLEFEQVTKAQRATHWSPCDERCTHAGPTRAVDSVDTGGDGAVIKYSATEMVDGGEGAYWQVEAAWRILTVHHLNERKHDLRWWNLVALCQRCHLHIQKKVTMEQVWPLEHSEWFKPYAAGWYAYAYLGEDLTRDETMARLDELLALECVA